MFGASSYYFYSDGNPSRLFYGDVCLNFTPGDDYADDHEVTNIALGSMKVHRSQVAYADSRVTRCERVRSDSLSISLSS